MLMTFIRELYKEFAKDVGLERAPALVPDHWNVIPLLKQELHQQIPQPDTIPKTRDDPPSASAVQLFSVV